MVRLSLTLNRVDGQSSSTDLTVCCMTSGVVLIWIRHCLVAALAMFMAGIVLTVLAIGVVTVLLQRGPLELPQLRVLVEDRMNTHFEGHDVRIESVALMSGGTGVGNRVMLKNVSIVGDDGAQLLAVPELRTQFSLLDIFNGRLSPKGVSIVGTELSLERDEKGAFSLFGNGTGVSSGENVLQLLDAMDEQTALASLTTIDLEDTKVTFRDRLTKRSWVLDNSKLTLQRSGDTISGRAVLELGDLAGPDAKPATMLLSGSYLLGSEAASVSFQFADASPTEIADLFQAFDWLRYLDTHLSGSVRADLAGDGTLGNLHGVLEMSEGRLTQAPAGQPVAFSTAKVYFDYDSKTDALNLDQVDLQTSSGNLRANGFVELQRGTAGRVQSMAGQLRLRQLNIKRPDLFDTDIAIKEAALDARLSFSPLRIDVGRLTVFDENSVIKVSGSSEASKTFWTNKYDVDIDQMETARLKQLWPKPVVWKTRKWVNENVLGGRFVGFAGGFRSNDKEPSYAFNFGLEGASFTFVKTMPPVRSGDGFGYLTEKDLRLDLSTGHVIAPNGARIDIGGTSLFIPDTASHPTPGEITLHAKSSLTGALEILNVEKFRFLDKVGLDPNLGRGAVSVSGTFKLPLSNDAKTEDVKLDLTADLLNFRSDVLVKGRVLTGRKLQARITDEGMRLSGNAELDSVPVNAVWTQSFDKGASKSAVSARLNINDKNLRAFGIILPKGTIKGETPAKVDITLNKGRDPQFLLTSDLVGATLRIDALSWSKSARTKGRFTISGSLGDTVEIDDFALKAPSLEAKGTLDLNANNSLRQARFSTVEVGRWLSTSAVLTPKGNGQTDISLNGGTADLRYLGDETNAGGDRSSNSTIKLALDRVRVTNELSLTNFTGKLTTKSGLRGTFLGRVNGRTRIDGQLFPQKHGTAIEFTSKDAGGVMASAELLKNARDGDLRVVLVPRPGKGNYDGTLDVKRARIKDASAMAALLNGISLVGALQQLEGEGIHFSSIEGQFKLRDKGVQLQKVSAVGPSMGMTLNGWYATKTKSVDFEGVITPLYALNGVFERIFGKLVGRTKGEGMFSFTYRMRGPSAKPKVAVNPLSILTPGAFREIFRQKAPKPPTQ